MFVKAFVFIAHVAAVIAARSDESDPCLSGNHRNITHLNERYLHRKNGCPFTDHRIENTWFYAGVNPIVTFPPNLCACGYTYPIWMNGSLPSISDGIVDRPACVKVLSPCHSTLNIQIKNCGEFFIYHLTPGPADSGYCFGIDWLQTTTEQYIHIPTATLEVLQDTITSSSFITAVNVTSETDFNTTMIIFIEAGSIIQTIPIVKPKTDYKWEHLLPETNYTVLIYTYVAGEKHVLCSVWTLTKPYHIATGSIKVQQTSISEESIAIFVTYNQGSENLTAGGTLKYQNGTVVRSFDVKKSASTHRFQNLTCGTRYHIELYELRGENHVVLDSSWVFTQPRIKAYLETTHSGDIVSRNISFRCEFEQLSDQSYTVRWAVQRAERNFTMDKSGASEHRILLALTENDLLKNHIHLPFSISCAVAQHLTATSQTDLSVPSNNLFAGIKLLTPELTIHRGETRNIKFVPTVPFGCQTQHIGQITCNMTMSITIPVKKACTGISTRSCRIHVLGNVNSEQNLQIQATEDGQYGVLKETTHDVILRIEPLENSIWSNYILPTVKVTVRPENETYWRGKRCEALNDPHMYTFDSFPYEHHEKMSDEYVLYTHTSYNAKIHHKLERCNTNAMCNCGVAVQAGRDIYLISTCNNILEIGYKQCDDGVLLVKQETDTKYTIYFPYGTSVTARLDKTPYSDSAGSMIVSVSVFPSVHDQQGRSRGLCGTLDNNPSNDFHGRSGELRLNRTEFIQAWRVSKDESLFKPNVRSTLPWMSPACTCSVTSGDVSTTEKCRHGADDNCSSGRTVGLQACKMAEKRNISKTGENTIPAVALDIGRNHIDSQSTQKGPAVTPKPTPHSTFVSELTSTTSPASHWNHNKAKDFCFGYMKSSRAFRLCALVPHTDTDRAIETCTQDIVLTQTTEWHRISRQSMQDSCITEIRRNKTVRESLEPSRLQVSTKPLHVTTTSSNNKQTDSAMTTPFDSGRHDSDLSMTEIIESIEEIACPNECFDRGTCQKGSCKCDFGYGSYDCSLDLSKPPSATSLLYGTLCDEKYAPCTQIFIRGGFFASKTVRCHIAKFETLSITKGRQNMDAYVLPGQAQTLIEVICPLRPNRQARSMPDIQDVKLISCYQVSVSNDGIHHGLPLEMCAYNSECQHITNRSDGILSAEIKVGFCFIGGECIPSGMNKTGDNRYCDPHTSLFQWTVRSRSTLEPEAKWTTDTVMAHVEAESSWMIPVLVAMICVCSVCVLVVLIACIRKRKQSKSESKNKEKEDVTVSFKPPPDVDIEVYAHINLKDISDDLPYVKTSITDDYTRLDKTNKETEGYAKLNAFQNNSSEDAPALPERYNGPEPYSRVSPGQQSDPYQTLTLTKRDDKDYEQLNSPSSDYLRPTFQSNVNPSAVFNSDEDFPEGYERPDPWNKQYQIY